MIQFKAALPAALPKAEAAERLKFFLRHFAFSDVYKIPQSSILTGSRRETALLPQFTEENMDRYTELLETQADMLSPDNDDYEAKLLEAAASFRNISESLSAFISEYGYSGNENDSKSKTAFIRKKFADEGIPVPRNIAEWFTSDKRIERNTAFQICFAFRLNVKQTDDFFRRVYLSRSFDCHSIKETVYYFCINNKLAYSDAESLIKQLPDDEKGRIDDTDILYTGGIVEKVRSFTAKEELIDYIRENISHFGYNNATATKYIREIWKKISAVNGIAYKEGRLIESAYLLSPEDRYAVVDKGSDSLWNIYSQILGLDNYQVTKIYTGRSIKSALVNNKLLPPLAEAAFPDRDGINKILNGVHVSNERIRKTMILLVFYAYWAEKIIENNNEFFRSSETDAERCLYRLNKYLLDSGYPEMYAGNPYDWIFLWAIKDDYPLLTFRNYMGELFAVKSEQSEN